MVTASSENNNREILLKNEELYGIVGGHCYSLLDVREVIDSEGKNDRII